MGGIGHERNGAGELRIGGSRRHNWVDRQIRPTGVSLDPDKGRRDEGDPGGAHAVRDRQMAELLVTADMQSEQHIGLIGLEIVADGKCRGVVLLPGLKQKDDFAHQLILMFCEDLRTVDEV
ncbi:hypothetical protein SDC9_96035 [bioreactor metagenome]|uniref:Uncharacterized protein n=1 Tax=bioreactor metagenome TaxID=1076179 RepID=A0A645A8Q6_9ZZZZ